MKKLIIAFGLFISVSVVAESQDDKELRASCLKNHPGITEAGCDCLVKEILSNKKIEKMFKKMNTFNDPPNAWPETGIIILALFVLGVTVFESLDWIAGMWLWMLLLF